MLQFLANNLEQLDLALEHISQGDANNARFGLMLTDNAVEITLHQLAKDKQNETKFYAYRREEFQHQAELDEALGRRFDAKLKFARLLGAVSDETAETITICHSFRNEVYHIGIQHEAVLPELAAFYFTVSCDAEISVQSTQAHLERYHAAEACRFGSPMAPEGKSEQGQ